jgi:hypothetical protein
MIVSLWGRNVMVFHLTGPLPISQRGPASGHFEHGRLQMRVGYVLGHCEAVGGRPAVFCCPIHKHALQRGGKSAGAEWFQVILEKWR